MLIDHATASHHLTPATGRRHMLSDRNPPIRATARPCAHVLRGCVGAGLSGERTPLPAVRDEWVALLMTGGMCRRIPGLGISER
jgi:hypothetical protein